MKAFIILDGNSRPVGAAMDEGMAMDVLFTIALQEGRIDEELGTFDFADNSVLSTDIEKLRESAFLTTEELKELEEKGAVIL